MRTGGPTSVAVRADGGAGHARARGWTVRSREWGRDNPHGRGWGGALVAAALPALGTARVDAELGGVGGGVGWGTCRRDVQPTVG